MRVVRVLALALAPLLLGASASLACETPPPDKPPVYAPAASISHACGDPLIRETLDNRDSTAPVTFHIRMRLFTAGWTTKLRTVPAGVLVKTPYRHLLGSTRVTVSARGHVLASRVIEPPGNYGVCKP